jgi:hypothetical protein
VEVRVVEARYGATTECVEDPRVRANEGSNIVVIPDDREDTVANRHGASGGPPGVAGVHASVSHDDVGRTVVTEITEGSDATDRHRTHGGLLYQNLKDVTRTVSRTVAPC